MMELSTRTLGDWLEHWALTTPDKEYIVYSDRNLRFTWKQFNERVDHMAKGLLAIGVKRGTHVGIWAGGRSYCARTCGSDCRMYGYKGC
jgi:fatty-acyl-CoA synthase